MKIFLYITLILISTKIIAQEKIIFKESFKDNKHQWKVKDNKDFKVSITNGKLRLEKKFINYTNRGCQWQTQNIKGFNTEKNFSILFKASYISGGDQTDMIDFQWGNSVKKEEGNSREIFQVDFDLKGKIRLAFFNNAWNYMVYKDIAHLLKNQNFDKTKANSYEIRQENGLLWVKINNVTVLTHKITPVKGSHIGVQQCLKSVWELDDLVIKQLGEQTQLASLKSNTDSLKTESSTTVINKTNQEQENITSTASTSTVFPNPFENDFKLSFNNPEKGVVKFNISTLNGVILQQHSKLLSEGQQHVDFFVDAASGLYLLQVEYPNKKTEVFKVIKK
ncbi:T9SS type A sorting domain-containing protein [Pedobacter glucosidilyticus]|uniref:T9SS type A sorting domain-containing protein n=1 Tax=Pedobacter glucosidilyticus TaxID=1122941 RepID=UPI0026EEAC2E|nr:T9SS type A sorting domain-containing protein [Pedobacter glucosidilyticus]